ncbi:IMPACT family member YigZ [Bifidobacterium dolichotidis]|uniref:IMPACT family member YigZ n=1 Tax=Bifidobacterium dolichotidis TaxID=2306976 RepID=A0A430FQ87_9BIFI|nr:YigZ family protein [Bifidobacterium dolichotidis]RSX54991.1 IMPACT family member YigZ [Bifidobacterium dolichotidis]
MRTLLNPPEEPAHDSFVEKKSEFIGDACHVESFEDALAFVQSIRDQHPKARHVAWAVVCTDENGNASERMSDDGEPSGTAGKPILEVLRMNELTNVAVTVTRYFGGILLGSGGLTRAYSTGASIAVKAAQQAQIVPCSAYHTTIEYTQLGQMQRLLQQMDGEQRDAEFTDRVSLTAVVPSDRAQVFEDQVRESFNATVSLEPAGTVMRNVTA